MHKIKEFAFINLFRALAAFWVLAEHCMIWGGWHGVPLPSAKIAVDLFMLISGYLMAANATSRWAAEPLNSPRHWLRFWSRRYFRLAPAYYLSLAIAILLAGPFLDGYRQLQLLNPSNWPEGGVYDPRTIHHTLTNTLLHLSFLFGLHPSYSFSTFLPDWSLSLEMQFYIAFPLLYLAGRRFGMARTALGLGLPTVVLGYLLSRQIQWFEPSLLLFKLNVFLAGMALHAALAPAQDRSQNASHRQQHILLASAVLLTSMNPGYPRLHVLVLPTLLLTMYAMARLEVTQRTPAWLIRLVSSRPVRFASDNSYGVYLFHGFFIAASGLLISHSSTLQSLHPALRVLCMFSFVVLGAYTTAHFVSRAIELPGIRLGKKLTDGWWPALRAETASPLSGRTSTN